MQGDFTKDPIGVELYNHWHDEGSDFDRFENKNLARRSEHQETLNQLHKLVIDHWDKVGLPDTKTFVAVPATWEFKGKPPNQGPPIEAPHSLAKWEIMPLKTGVPACAWSTDETCPPFQIDHFMVGKLGAQECPEGSIPITDKLNCEKFARASGFHWSYGWELQNGQQCHWCAGCRPETVRLHRDHRGKAKFVCLKSGPVVHTFHKSSSLLNSPKAVSAIQTSSEMEMPYDPAVDAGLIDTTPRVSLLLLDAELTEPVVEKREDEVNNACISSPLCGLLSSEMRGICKHTQCADQSN